MQKIVHHEVRKEVLVCCCGARVYEPLVERIRHARCHRIAYNMTNNYMFRFVLQQNEKVLKGLICALLHLKPEQIKKIEMMLNVKTYHTYSDKFVLSVLDLNKTELATEEDKAYGIDYWAHFFKAQTWEELKELIKDNEFLQEAADSIYKANADEIVRQQCRAREEAERRERTLERNIKILQDDLENTKEERDKFKAEYENMKVELERLKKKYNED